jgi:hypothetical protein
MFLTKAGMTCSWMKGDHYRKIDSEQGIVVQDPLVPYSENSVIKTRKFRNRLNLKLKT